MSFNMHTNAKEMQRTRIINVVYDDSGSMIGENNVMFDTWCKAKYSMEAFAAMMGDGDTMNIYYMSDYMSNTQAEPRLRLSGKDGAQKNVSLIHNTVTQWGQTPFDSVIKAYDDLAAASADEKWLVILTDGAFQIDPRNDNYYCPDIDSFLSDKADDVKVIYLGIGEEAIPITQNIAKNIYYENAATTDEILDRVTTVCNRVFDSHKLNVDVSNSKVSFDIPMSQLIIFAQGGGVGYIDVKDPNGKSIKSDMGAVSVKYSEEASPGLYGLVDTSLEGVIVTLDGDFDAGTYSIEVSNATTLEVYYKPNVDIAAYLIDQNGNYVTDLQNLEAGDYTIEFGFVKAGTDEKVPNSKLLGDITYEADIYNNGQLLAGTYASGDKISVLEGALDIDVTAHYLDYGVVTTSLNYSIYRNKTVDIQIVTIPEYQIMVTPEGMWDGILNGFICYMNGKDVPIVLHLKVDGREFTESEWRQTTGVDVDLIETGIFSKATNKKYKITNVIKSDDIGDVLVYVDLAKEEAYTGAYGNPTIAVHYNDIINHEQWVGDTSFNLEIIDSRSGWIKFVRIARVSIAGAFILFILIGYIPGIKGYLPRSIKKHPTIEVSFIRPPAVPVVLHDDRGTFRVDWAKGGWLPYTRVRGSIRVAPTGSGVPSMQVMGLKIVDGVQPFTAMRLLNAGSFERVNGRFDGTEISELEDKAKRKFNVSGRVRVETQSKENNMEYVCNIDQS